MKHEKGSSKRGRWQKMMMNRNEHVSYVFFFIYSFSFIWKFIYKKKLFSFRFWHLFNFHLDLGRRPPQPRPHGGISLRLHRHPSNNRQQKKTKKWNGVATWILPTGWHMEGMRGPSQGRVAMRCAGASWAGHHCCYAGVVVILLLLCQLLCCYLLLFFLNKNKYHRGLTSKYFKCT